jgi:hypothetical protein
MTSPGCDNRMTSKHRCWNSVYPFPIALAPENDVDGFVLTSMPRPHSELNRRTDSNRPSAVSDLRAVKLEPLVAALSDDTANAPRLVKLINNTALHRTNLPLTPSAMDGAPTARPTCSQVAPRHRERSHGWRSERINSVHDL